MTLFNGTSTLERRRIEAAGAGNMQMNDHPVQSAMPRLIVDTASGVPLHRQFEQGLRREIERGALKAGDRLPTVNRLAAHLSVAPQTVMRAYAELQRQGILEARRGVGTFVAEPPTPCSELLLPSWVGNEPHRGPISRATYLELVDGLREGFGQAERRFCLTHFDGGAPPVREVLEVCAARRADSIVALAGVWEEDYLAQIARSVPIVALFTRLASGEVDTVDADPCAALRAMLERRLAAGARQFAYVGAEFLLGVAAGRPSVYMALLEVFREVTRGAGAEVTEQIVPCGHPDPLAAMAAAGQSVPEAAVLLAGTPSVATAIDPEGRRFDLISYTESAETLKNLRGKVSLAYVGLRGAANAAARLLRRRQRLGLEAPVRRVVLPAEVHEARDGT